MRQRPYSEPLPEPPRTICSASRAWNRSRKALIAGFVWIHFAAVIAWILPPYSEMVANSAHADHLAGRIEKRLFTLLSPKAEGPISGFVQSYVNVLGAHQYWDFFAPEIPRIHRYLEVCTEILESPNDGRIQCIGPLYQSFEGKIDQAAQPHRGKQSRSFRLVENLYRLHRPDLLNAFTLYWRRKNKSERNARSYLVLHEFMLGPGSRDSMPGRRDELLWIAPD